MEMYEQWLQEARNAGLKVIENIPFESDAKGLICGDCIGLSNKIPTSSEKTCILVEEIGHYHTGVGNILDLSSEQNRKQETHGRLWAYDKLIGLSGIIKGHHARCHSSHELAEFLGVTESFLHEALNYYHHKYGIYVKNGLYTIIFEPSLAVVESIK